MPYDWTESDENLLVSNTESNVYKDILDILKKSENKNLQKKERKSVDFEFDRFLDVENAKNKKDVLETGPLFSKPANMTEKKSEKQNLFSINNGDFITNNDTLTDNKSESSTVSFVDTRNYPLDSVDDNRKLDLIYEYFEKDKKEDENILRKLREFERKLEE